MLVYRMAICNYELPTVFTRKVTELVCMLAVTAMIVAINRHAAGVRRLGKSRITGCVLAEAVKDL